MINNKIINLIFKITSIIVGIVLLSILYIHLYKMISYGFAYGLGKIYYFSRGIHRTNTNYIEEYIYNDNIMEITVTRWEEPGIHAYKTDPKEYIRKMKIKKRDNSYYISFINTFGNNPENATNKFELELDNSCDKIYVWFKDEYRLMMEKIDDTWCLIEI